MKGGIARMKNKIYSLIYWIVAVSFLTTLVGCAV